MKKAQMEIMGLAVIVILLMLGLLFVVRFIILNEPSELRQSFTRTQLAANLLNTILKTNTNCLDTTINELIKDCSTATVLLTCPGPDAKTSCQFAEEATGTILNETLTYQGNRSFNFIAHINNDKKLQITNGDCSGEKDVETQPLPTAAGTLTVRMEICS